jgi:ABC-type Fe3+-hydroxamate transport system substrate-binding protein
VIFKDQLGQHIELTQIPKRIISLVPSQSELLWDLGLRDELIGITKFCIHPNEMFKFKDRVGGTKTLDIHKIRSLKPDLIIGNKEENEYAQRIFSCAWASFFTGFFSRLVGKPLEAGRCSGLEGRG